MPNIMKIRQCFLELQLKMSGMFVLRHTVELLQKQLVNFTDSIRFHRKCFECKIWESGWYPTANTPRWM